jgi:cytochrome c-type biogenesis protein CcmF
VNVTRDGQKAGTLVPSKFIDQSYNDRVGETQHFFTEVAIRTTLVDDLYVVLTNWNIEEGTADFQVKINPLVLWIWIGGGLFLVGGLIAFWPGREVPQAIIAVPATAKKQTVTPATPQTKQPPAQPARPVSPAVSRKKKARHGKR